MVKVPVTVKVTLVKVKIIQDGHCIGWSSPPHDQTLAVMSTVCIAMVKMNPAKKVKLIHHESENYPK